MGSVLDIPVRRLFLLALSLKILSSLAGWLLQMPWSLGFAIPLIVMCLYILLGLKRHDASVSDEKFADSCYYLGFIFTITSIIFALFDLPSIGERIQDIAVRFGAAMVSTVLGLGVRVYLVSFRKDAEDAIRDAEDALLDATQRFTHQLVAALERLQSFGASVDDAAEKSVHRVNIQVEKLSSEHAKKLGEFFGELATHNRKTFDDALNEVRKSSNRLSDSLDGYGHGLRTNLDSIQAKVNTFAQSVEDRLARTTFPDDYFSRHLASPMEQLQGAANAVLEGVRAASDSVSESSAALGVALESLRRKATKADNSLDMVIQLTQQQQAVLNAANGQLEALSRIPSLFDGIAQALGKATDALGDSRTVSAGLASHIEGLVKDINASAPTLAGVLERIAGSVEDNTEATRSLAKRVGAATSATEQAAAKLVAVAEIGEKASESIEASSAASERIAAELGALAAADIDAARALGSIEASAVTAIGRVEEASANLGVMVTRLEDLDQALRTQSFELAQLAGQFSNANDLPSATGLLPSPLLGTAAVGTGAGSSG